MDGVVASKEKWGEAAIAAGFSVLPNHLLAINQFLPPERHISPTEMMVTLQILLAWWSTDRFPFPSKNTIAQRAGLSPRQVQRALSSLETKGLVTRISRFGSNRGRTSNQYDVTGLVRLVWNIAEENPTAFKKQLKVPE